MIVESPPVSARRLDLPADFNVLDVHGAALALAQAGFFVFPVKGSSAKRDDYPTDEAWRSAWKEPIDHGRGKLRWSVASTRDVRQITAWFAGTGGLGIGVDCGKSGLVVVDEDTVGLVDHLLDPTLVQTTGKGRHQIYLRPPGRRIGNGTGKMPAGFGDIRGAGGYIVVAPSPHPMGVRYRFVDPTVPIAVLPDAVADLLPGKTTDTAEAATSDEVTAFLSDRSVADKNPGLRDALIGHAQKQVADGASRHATTVAVLAATMTEAAAGYYSAQEAVDALAAWFRKVKPEAAADEFASMLRWAVAQAKNADADETRRQTEHNLAKHDLKRFWRTLDGFLEQPEQLAFLAAMATAATSKLDGEPLWLLIVGPPSGGKTEAVRVAERCADDHIAELTGAAALLAWTKRKPPKPTGVLARLTAREITHSLMTIRDLSPLLASSDRGGRDEVYSKLRDIYDGRCRREVGQEDRPLQWEGRMTLIAAVTPAIDNYAGHAQALGDRWLYLRLPAVDEDTAQAKALRALDADADKIAAGRDKAAWIAQDIIGRGRRAAADVRLDGHSVGLLADAAVVTSRARAAVPRNGYGRREIDGVPVVEETPRMARQLGLLARGLVAIGIDEPDAVRFGVRAAVESAPPDRLRLLTALADAKTTGELPTTADLQRATGLHRNVVRMRLEELGCVGVVQRQGNAPEPDGDSDRAPHDRRPWRLADNHADRVTHVLAVLK